MHSNASDTCTYELTVAVGDLPRYSDKVVLPPFVLEDILAKYAENELPHPLIFRVSSQHLDSALVGVKEFVSEDTAVVPQYILEKLRASEGDEITIDLVTDIPKGTFLKVKPLQFYRNVTNWKYFLESQLTNYYTTLTKGETLVIEDGPNTYELAIEDINARSVSIIDTDIVLDVIPLNDIMAQQTLDYHIANKEQEIGLDTELLMERLQPFNANPNMTVYKLDLLKARDFDSVYIGVEASNQMDQSLTEVFNVDVIAGFDNFLSLENFAFTTMDQDFEAQTKSRSAKSVAIPIRNNDDMASRINKCLYDLENGYAEDEVAKWLYIVPFTWEVTADLAIRVSSKPFNTEEVHQEPPEANALECKNCKKMIGASKMLLHETYCFKNNVVCSCGKVFLKAIPSTHWHCRECSQYTDASLFVFKHTKLFHQVYKCDKCTEDRTYSDYVALVTKHKATVCAQKMHECRFCKLILPQGKATIEDRFEQLTHHENMCGNKTDECPKCNKLVRRKDFRKHAQIHKFDLKSQTEDLLVGFNKCTNANCINLADTHNEMSLCDFCYGPLYNAVHDPTNIKLQSRIERRYVLQLTKGCDQALCSNQYCRRNLSQPLGFKEAINKIHNELMLHISRPQLPINKTRQTHDNCFWFCVNDKMAMKMQLFTLYQASFRPELLAHGLNQIGPNEPQLVQWLQERA